MRPYASRLDDAVSLLGLDIGRVASTLTRDWAEPSSEIDIPATVDATARAGGLLTLVRESRIVRPRFVALVETASRHDHQAALADAVLARLRFHGVPVHQFAFRPDSELLLPSDSGRAVWLHDVIDRQRYRAVWVFGDGAWLLSRGRALLELARHREVILYTSLSTDEWSERERTLASAGVIVTPAADAWLRREGGREQPAIRQMDPLARAPLPRAVFQEAWTKNLDAPKSTEVESVLTGLRAWLDDSGYQWLCALAPLPVLRWPLTLSIGSELRDDAGRRVLNGERLAALARLPWFRIGSMPDWLRERLLRDLSDANAVLVRESWAAWRASFESRASSPGGAKPVPESPWDELEMVGPAHDRILPTLLHNKHWMIRLVTKWLRRIVPASRP